MTSDARFGIEFTDPGARQPVSGVDALVVGHVWSPDAARIVVFPDSTVHVVDPSGANPVLLNSSLDATHAFLDGFAAFYSVERPPVVRAMTKDEARAKLAALQRGEVEAAPAPFVPAPREGRVEALHDALAEVDPVALESGSWWPRIFDELNSGRL